MLEEDVVKIRWQAKKLYYLEAYEQAEPVREIGGQLILLLSSLYIRAIILPISRNSPASSTLLAPSCDSPSLPAVIFPMTDVAIPFAKSCLA